jgi:hypothetical protein
MQNVATVQGERVRSEQRMGIVMLALAEQLHVLGATGKGNGLMVFHYAFSQVSSTSACGAT